MTAAGEATNLAAGLMEPARAAEVEKHYTALVTAMNGSVDARGEQDALAVFEAIAILLGQITSGMDDSGHRGVLSFVTLRAVHHAATIAKGENGARIRLEPDDIGQGGHA